jgi:hypothetical protein
MEELEVLVEDVAVNKQLLLGKFSNTTTNERMKKVWKNISAKMSAVGDTKRCSDDVKKNGRNGRAKLKTILSNIFSKNKDGNSGI